MRARERERLDWPLTALRRVQLADHYFRPDERWLRIAHLKAALRIITIHGPVPIRREARLLLEGLK